MTEEVKKTAPEKKYKPRRHIMTEDAYNKVFEELSTKYPKLFIKDAPMLLKIGVFHDIVKDMQLEPTNNPVIDIAVMTSNHGSSDGAKLNKTLLRKFLQIYCSQQNYKKLHIEGAKRYDISGKEVDVVTAEQVESMKQNLAAIEVKRKEKAKKKNEARNQNNKSNKEASGKSKAQDKPYKKRNTDINKEVDGNKRTPIKSSYSNKPKLGLKL